MDFDLTPEHVVFRDAVRGFARDVLSDGELLERDNHHDFSRAAWKRCAEFGLTGLIIPESLGGQGADPVAVAVAMEALGEGCEDNGLIFSLNAHLWSCVLPILKFGDEAQRARWLPGLANGTLIGVQAMTEPETGSDAFALRTRAELDGDEVILTGAKTFVTNAPVADLFVVFARTAPGPTGVDAYLVERDAPGLTVGPAFRKMGLRTSPTAEVHLERCRIPRTNRLGGAGAGVAIFTTSMDWERSFIMASAIGTMQRQLDRAVRYAQEREQFGQPIGRFQAVSHRLVDVRVRLEAARLMQYQLAWRKAQGRRSAVDSAIVKLFVSEAFLSASLDTLQTHGGLGYLEDAGLERDVRDAVASRIYSGTSDIQRTIVARGMGLS